MGIAGLPLAAELPGTAQVDLEEQLPMRRRGALAVKLLTQFQRLLPAPFGHGLPNPGLQLKRRLRDAALRFGLPGHGKSLRTADRAVFKGMI